MEGELRRMLEGLPDGIGDVVCDLLTAHASGDAGSFAVDVDRLIDAVDDYGFDRSCAGQENATAERDL